MAEMMSEDQYMERKRWVFLGLPFTFTTYHVAENVITIDSGFFRKVENDCYMYKVQDVELVATFFERIAGLGTVICYTGDTTHPKLMLEHIKNAKTIELYSGGIRECPYEETYPEHPEYRCGSNG